MAKAPAHRVKKKRSGRFMVRARGGRMINGVDKVKILLDDGLIKTKLPAKKEGQSASADESAGESTGKAEG